MLGVRTRPRAAARLADAAPGSIDSYIFADWRAHGITPAAKTTDWEFIRRVTLDLTGRIPAPDRVLRFVADTDAAKRAKLIDELIAKPEWVDKWTMYFGDLFRNSATKSSTALIRGADGRNAFYQWIKDSLASGKAYNQMATELISAAGSPSYSIGPLNFLVGGVLRGFPMQDTVDQMTANVFTTFLGVGHVNCVLCHNGRGHLDGLSLWGATTTRYQAWQLASFLSHTQATGGSFSWGLVDDSKGFDVDYALNTTDGNRPPRQPIGDSGNVAPVYIFNGDSPRHGERYRVALARNITGDLQFVRALVNYLWAEFFSRGLVDPPDLFDPARMDPDNPPPAPWTLQASNPRLLNALAQHFVDGGYNLRSIMREIVNSETYQLSTQYDGVWDPAWEPYFARKYVRRLWAEELHDGIAQSTGTLPDYGYAMQLPEPYGMPPFDSDARAFLDTFLRGNRDDQVRRQDGSILQALAMMNSPLVDAHVRVDSTLIGKSDTDLIRALFLNVLSRYPTDDEMAKSAAAIGGASDRAEAAQDLLWSLFNRVDFIFNY
jgi:hypothetical protein